MYNSSEIAARIKSIIAEQNTTQEILLKKCGLNKNTLSNYKTSFPTTDKLAKIADELNVSVDYLLGRPTYDVPVKCRVVLELFLHMDEKAQQEFVTYGEYLAEQSKQRLESKNKPKD